MFSKNKNEKLIAIALLIVLIIILFPMFKRGAAGKIITNKITKKTASGPSSTSAENKNISPEESPDAAEYKEEGSKDPFSVPDSFRNVISHLLVPKQEDVALPSLSVSGAVWGGASPQAIINGKILKEGDTIEGATILKIEKEGIILLYRGRQVTIPLSKPFTSGINQLQR